MPNAPLPGVPTGVPPSGGPVRREKSQGRDPDRVEGAPAPGPGVTESSEVLIPGRRLPINGELEDDYQVNGKLMV